MATLVQRLRSVLSAEEDDFFEDDTLLSYLNASQQAVVSYFVSIETRTPRTLRALDKLRKTSPVAVTATPTLLTGETYKATLNVPTDLLQLVNIVYDSTVPCRELPPNKLNQLFAGNATPSANEIFYVTGLSGSTRIYTIYTFEDEIKTCDLYYFANPASLVLGSTSLTSLPSQLENAVIYGAAVMLLMQEAPRDPNITPSTNALREIYTSELQGGTF